MSQMRKGYNNPAFCNQFDSTLYDYEYVPEIDPDSPDLEKVRSYRTMKQVSPWVAKPSNIPKSDESNGSDESNNSIIVEECNNRRVTLICEKRSKVIPDDDGGYSHNISIDSNDDKDEIDIEKEKLNFHFDRSKNRSSFQTDDEKKRNYRNGPDWTDASTNRTLMASKPVWQTRPYPQNHRYEELDDCIEVSPDIPPRMKMKYQYEKFDDELSDEFNREFEAEGVHFEYRRPQASSANPLPVPPRRVQVLRDPYTPEEKSKGCDEALRYDYPPSPGFGSYPTEFFRSKEFSPIDRPSPVGSDRKSNFRMLAKIGASSPNLHSKTSMTSPKSFKIVKTKNPSTGKLPTRRNLSESFSSDRGSPYKPTTTSKSKRNLMEDHVFIGGAWKYHEDKTEKQGYQLNNLNDADMTNIRRNQSVPNLKQLKSIDRETSLTPEKCLEFSTPQKNGRKAAIVSPQRFMESPPVSASKFSPTKRSCTSLLEASRVQWYDCRSPIIGAAMVQAVAGTLTCILCFYLISRMGRRYYLDLAMLASFINFVIGVLGFRLKNWKWLPNRNYVSGYLLLSVFSVITCACVSIIIIFNPRTGDPLMDTAVGAIYTITVVIIAIVLAGCLLSGTCKGPPSDNRVGTV